MNRRIMYIAWASLLLFNACNDKIIIQRLDNEMPVIVKMNNGIEQIVGIKFPFDLEIENKSILKKEFFEIDYDYGFRSKGAGVELYINNEPLRNSGLKSLKGKSILTYKVYSRHVFDTTSFIHEELYPYLNRMLKKNQDTLHLGSIDLFKENHPILFELLTAKDTIAIWTENKNSYGIKISIPANW